MLPPDIKGLIPQTSVYGNHYAQWFVKFLLIKSVFDAVMCKMASKLKKQNFLSCEISDEKIYMKKF